MSSSSLYAQLVESFDLPVQEGAWLQELTEGGPADRARLRGGEDPVRFQAQPFSSGGDVVTRIGDTAIEDADDLSDAIARYEPGAEVPVRVYRDGRPRTITVTLGERPLDAAAG